jgi:hypothetical protein
VFVAEHGPAGLHAFGVALLLVHVATPPLPTPRRTPLYFKWRQFV